MTKEIVKKESTELSTDVNLDALAGSTEGLEETSASDFSPPILKLLQDISPEVKKTSEKRIDGAEEGMFYITSSGKLFDGKKGIDLIPAYYAPRWTHWQNEKQGGLGKLLGVYKSEEEPIFSEFVRENPGTYIHPQTGDTITFAATHFCLLYDEEAEEWTEVIVPLRSTQVKKSKQWNNIIRQKKRLTPSGKKEHVPAFTNIYRMTSVVETKDQYSYYGVNVAFTKEIPFLSNEDRTEESVGLVLRAKEFHDLLMQDADNQISKMKSDVVETDSSEEEEY